MPFRCLSMVLIYEAPGRFAGLMACSRRRLRLIDMTTSLTAVDRRGVLLGSVAGTVSTVNGPFMPIGGDRYGVGT